MLNDTRGSVDIGRHSRFCLVSLREIVESFAGVRLLGLDSPIMLSVLAPLMGNPANYPDQNFPTLEGPDDFRNYLLQQVFPMLIEQCRFFGLPLSVKAAERLQTYLAKSTVSWDTFHADCAALSQRILDELELRLFLQVQSDKAGLYTEPLNGWEHTIDRFPSASFDIEESGKSLALNRYTASVYHSMRIAELALASVAARIGMTNSRPNWNEVMTYIEGQVKKNYTQMDSLFKGDVDFLSETAAHMRSVNIAWRRRVAHIESKYTEEEATTIYQATRSLTEHVATKLAELE